MLGYITIVPLLSNPQHHRRIKKLQIGLLLPALSITTPLNILKAIFGVGVAAATGGIGWRLFDQNRSQTNRETPPNRTKLSNRQLDTLPLEVKNFYIGQLTQLNEEILKNPNQIKEIAPKVGHLVVQYFCSEMGYNPKDYEGKLLYEDNEEYLHNRAEESGCITKGNVDDEYGRVQVDKNELAINLGKVLYHDVSKKEIQKFPALSLFGTILHELHHVTAPILPDPDSTEPNGKLRGMGKLMPNPENSRENYICYGGLRKQLEEAIVLDSSERMERKLNIGGQTANQYTRWRVAYRAGVIDKLFGGDNKPLLKLHQQTRQAEFFGLVGKMLGATEAQAQDIGEKYLTDVMVNNIF